MKEKMHAEHQFSRYVIERFGAKDGDVKSKIMCFEHRKRHTPKVVCQKTKFEIWEDEVG